MALFADRRSGVVHDLDTGPHDLDEQVGRLQSWANVHADARAGLAAATTRGPARSAHNVLPGMAGPAPRKRGTPNNPVYHQARSQRDAELRQSVGAQSRVAAWAPDAVAGSRATQGVAPGSPLARSGSASQTVLPASRRQMSGASGWLAKPLRAGASFAQKTRRR